MALRAALPADADDAELGIACIRAPHELLEPAGHTAVHLEGRLGRPDLDRPDQLAADLTPAAESDAVDPGEVDA